MKKGGGEGETGRGTMGKEDWERAMGRGRRATGRGATRRGRWGGGQRVGGDEKGGERRGQAHRMPGWNEVAVFSDFVNPCNAGYLS